MTYVQVGGVCDGLSCLLIVCYYGLVMMEISDAEHKLQS